MLLNSFVETMIHFFKDSLRNRDNLFTIANICNYKNIFTGTFDGFNASLLNTRVVRVFAYWLKSKVPTNKCLLYSAS